MAAKKIRTVLGDVKPEEIGRTLCHEHLYLDFTLTYKEPDDVSKGTCPFTMENLGWIRQNPYSHKPNLAFTNQEEAIVEELRFYKQNGGSCMVENTTKGIHRNLPFFKKLSEATGVHIIAGGGYYVNESHPAHMDTVTVESLYTEMVTDITEGSDGTPIKCGVLGELGCSYPLTDNEKKVLQGAAQAQAQTGCPVIIHPGRHPSCPEEILRVIGEAGGNIKKTVMSHLDRTIIKLDELVEFASMGSYCEYDLFGIEVSHYALCDIDMPSDAERIQRIKHLIENGFEDKITIAHDIHTKHRLTKYGGHGYSHIFLNVIPKMKARGFSEEVINKILVENPRQWLQF